MIMRFAFASILTAALSALAAFTAHAEDRFPLLTPEQMTPEQTKLVKALLAGPRGGGDMSPEAVAAMLKRGPFNAWMRSPALGERLQAVGEYIRYNTSLPLRLNEFAILITARHWTSQYEWYAHHRAALAAGLSPAIADAIAAGKRPIGMQKDEEAVYTFCTEILTTKQVSDATFKTTKDAFGEKGVVDLIGVMSWYQMVSMLLNTDRYPLPDGVQPALKPLN
jgi:4-carboxymuconolactone decarboxylase